MLLLGTVIHELMHAVGFDHEHNRSDRDNYLDIHWENIQDNFKFAFQKLAPAQNRILEPFDYNSIMIYGEKGFSKNGLPSMTAKNGVHITDPYSKPGFALTDINAIKKLYHC